MVRGGTECDRCAKHRRKASQICKSGGEGGGGRGVIVMGHIGIIGCILGLYWDNGT